MSAKKKAPSTTTTLVDSSVPWEHRKQLLMQLILEGSEESDNCLKPLLDGAAAANGEALHAKKAQELAELIQQMEQGLLRSATFVELLNGPVRRAQVLLQDGTVAFTTVPNADLAAALRCGDAVLLEAQGKALLDRGPDSLALGEEARLERRLDAQRVEVTFREQERHVYRAADRLVGKLDAGEVKPGSSLLVCPRRRMAFDAIPAADGLSHYRYLVREPIPDIVVARDIGAPAAFLADLAEHVRREMLDPSLARRYRLRRAVMKLLTGVSGSGKTLHIQGLWRLIYEVMSAVTRTPIDQLPPRVMRLRMAQVLSKWLGESDKQIDRFFDEVDQLAEETFIAPDGKEYKLPVLTICEECDGLARSRGEEAIYDRIQTTLLQRLDVTCQKVKDKLVLFLFTTNVPQLVDPAFLRRAGGTTERFGRLNRRSFVAVLRKHLRGLPFQNGKGGEPADYERDAVSELTAWLFSPNGQDKGQVELVYAGSTTPVCKYRRDFLTGALVDRAVQQAAAEACQAEHQGCPSPGLSPALLTAAFDRQIRSIVDQLHRDNVGQYLDLPDGVRVTTVRRIEQPAVLPAELERAS